jgi:hypothetical protein
MTTLKRIALLFSLFLTLSIAGVAQQQDSAKQPTLPVADAPSVTMSLTTKGVRFSVPGAIGQVRLEVFDHAGVSLYNSDFQPATVFDWPLQNKERQALADGTYLCVITLRGVTGKLGVKQGTVLVQNGQAALQLDEVQAGAVESERSLTAVADSTAYPATITVHDGQNGQVVTTGGALTFRIGNFFAGLDRERMRLTADGRLGIGTDKPEAELDVAGTIRARGGIRFEDGTVLTSAGPTAGGSTLAATSPGGISAAAVNGTGTSGKLLKWTDGAGGVAGDSTVTEVNGNIGIGTASVGTLNGVTFPSIGLHVKGSGQSKYIVVDDSTNVGLMLNDSSQSPDNRMWGFFNKDSRFSVSTFSDAGDPTERMSVLRNGNVGIGTASVGNLNGVTFPSIGLHVKGTGQSKYLAVDDSTNVGVLLNDSSQSPDNRMWGFFNKDSRFSISTFSDAGDPTERMNVTRSGNVGIGTAIPMQKLDVTGNIKLTGAGSALIFPDGTSMTTAASGGGGGGVSGSGTTGAVALWSGSTTLGNSAITQMGNDVLVNGNFSATGNLSAKYQDVAEWVPARGHVLAGTVVSLDRSRNNTVMPSARAYDTRVAGVVSARPGLVLGESAPGRVMVATTGRVKVRVDARRGAVRIGDLLVTSGKPGVAMKSLPIKIGGARMHRPGTIVGKALEPLAKGQGEILVLLSLQ